MAVSAATGLLGAPRADAPAAEASSWGGTWDISMQMIA